MNFRSRFSLFFFNLKTNINYQLSFVALIMILGAVIVWIGVFYSTKFNGQILSFENINSNTNSINANSNTNSSLIRKIDGELISDSNKINLPPIGVMIENLASSDVRPQSGLSQAQIVYEMLVEGGITRFLAVYATDEEIEQIGPVRSARPSYIEIISEFDALYVHAGGSPEALEVINGFHLKDCSALGADSKYYWRDEDLQAPHNLFTSSELINFAVRDKKIENSILDYSSWKFQADNQKSKSVQVSDIKIDFSTPEYRVEWKYDEKKNTYLRLNGNEAQYDANNDDPLAFKNIIIQIVPQAIAAGDDGRINFDLQGEGKAFIYNNGQKIEATWKKDSRTSRTMYYQNNAEVSFVPGNTWIEILPQDKSFTSN